MFALWFCTTRFFEMLPPPLILSLLGNIYTSPTPRKWLTISALIAIMLNYGCNYMNSKILVLYKLDKTGSERRGFA